MDQLLSLQRLLALQHERDALARVLGVERGGDEEKEEEAQRVEGGGWRAVGLAEAMHAPRHSAGHDYHSRFSFSDTVS